MTSKALYFKQCWLFPALATALFLVGCSGSDDATLVVESAPESVADISVPPVELPDTVWPQHYRLWFRPDAALKTFSGRADVEIKITQSVPSIKVAARNLKFDPTRLTLSPGGTKLVPVPQSKGDLYQLRSTTGDIPAGTYMLHMEWTGSINFTEAEGLFKVGLQGADGGQTDAIVTQGESNLARQWFPGWDEPAFRHTFEVSAEVPSDWRVVSNGALKHSTRLSDGYQRVDFDPTPAMPAYLLFFGGGHFDTLEDQFISPLDGTVMPLRWFTPAGEAHSAQLPMQFAKEALDYYYRYFDVPLPLAKLDNLAVNDHYENKNAGFGGMENWGAIFYFANEVLVPQTGTQTSIKNDDKAFSFVITSHEIAHQWFGDLVTHDWWDNIWLNESFANWFENVTKIKLHPEFEGNNWVAYAAQKQRIFMRGLEENAVPVQHNLSDAGSGDFLDPFAYSKGGHIIQMLENYIGADAMQKGLQSYLKKYRLGHGTPARLWAELEQASGQPVGKIGNSFVRQTGFPLLTVNTQCNSTSTQNTVTLSQSAFPSKNPYPGTLWNIPVTLAYGEGLKQRRTLVVDQPSTQMTLEGCSAVLANPSGLDYYVTNYSPASWLALLAQSAALPDEVFKTNLLGDAKLLYNNGLLSSALYDQISALKGFQPTLRALQKIERKRKVRTPQLRRIHRFKYKSELPRRP